MARARFWLLPSFEALLFCLLFLSALVMMPTMLNGDGDLGRHLTVGAYILDNRAIPQYDVWSHTLAGAHFVPHEWLSEIVFALVLSAWGMNGVAWLTAFLIAAAYATLAGGLRLLGISAPLAFGMALVAFAAGSIHHLPRPHLFTLLLFTILLILLELFRMRRRWVVLLPAPFLMLIWANLHGGFVLGLVLVLMYLVGALLDRDGYAALALVCAGAAMLGASFINPAGGQALTHGLGYAGSRFLVDATVEYTSPNFHNVSAFPFALLILLSIAMGARGSLKLDSSRLLALLGWTALALYSARNIPLYAQIAVVVMAAGVQKWIEQKSTRVNRILGNLDRAAPVGSGAVWVVVAVLLMSWVEAEGTPLDPWREGNRFSARRFPVAAVEALEPLPKGEMFNDFIWGGYLLYRLYPDKRVFIDGQTDFYGEELARTYMNAINAKPGWESILERYQVEWVIVPPGTPLARELDRSAGWRKRFGDEVAGVWVRVN